MFLLTIRRVIQQTDSVNQYKHSIKRRRFRKQLKHCVEKGSRYPIRKVDFKANIS